MEQKETLSGRLRVIFKGFGEAGAKFLMKLGLTPNAVTVIACVGHIFAFWCGYKGYFPMMCFMLFIFSMLDFFDGTMSRMMTNGKGTKWGAVLDSTLDRYSEFMAFGGLLLYYAERTNVPMVALCIVAMMGAFLVPYTRAKGEIYGLDMRLGIMSRFERYFILGAFLLFNLPHLGIAAVAIFSNITAFQRLFYMRKMLK